MFSTIANFFSACLFEFFFLIDLFKTPIFLYLEKKPKSFTGFGTFVSFLIYIYLGVLFCKSDVFWKASPIIIDQAQILTNRPEIKLNSSNFALSIGITDTDSNAFIDPTIFSLYIVLKRVNGLNISNEFKSLHACNDTDFPGEMNTTQNFRLGNYFCLDDSDLELKGYWNEPSLSYTMILLEVCQNYTGSQIICKSHEEIQEFFLEKYFSINYKDYNYDMTNFSHPTQKMFNTEFSLIDQKINKKLTLTFRKTEIIDDQNLIYDETNSIEVFKKDSSQWDFVSHENEDRYIFALCLYSSSFKQKVVRRYQKLHEAISNLGGSASILILIGMFLTKIQNKLNQENLIMNKLYSVQTRKKNLPPSIEKKLKSIKFQNSIIENSKNNKKQALAFKKPLDESHIYKDCLNEINENTEKKPISSIEKLNFFANESPIAQPKKKPQPIMLEEFKNSENNSVRVSKDKKNEILYNNENAEKKEKKPTSSFEKLNFFTNESPIIKPKKKSHHMMFEDFKNSENKSVRVSKGKKNEILPNLNPKQNLFNLLKKRIFNSISIRKKIDTNLQKKNNLPIEKEKINITTWEYIKMKVKDFFDLKLLEKEKIILKVENLFEEQLDIIRILKALQDVEKLKMILFNKKQLALFDLLAKPLIFVYENECEERSAGEKLFKKMENKIANSKYFGTRPSVKKIQNIQEILNSYKNESDNQEINEIDKRLLKFIDKNLENFVLNYGKD